MAIEHNLMSQLTFKFPFKKKYYEQDFYVSKNNFSVFKLIESWPNWPEKWVNIFGPVGCGKTHLANILKKKIKKVFMIEAIKIDNTILTKFQNINCIIIDNYSSNIDEKLLYTILNQSKQEDKYIVINSITPIKDITHSLKDLRSRIASFINFGIELPTDDLLRVIITKYFSDKQIEISPKVSEYIIKNVERSYEKVFKIIKEIDELSLSSGKSININLIKKVLENE